MILYNTLMGVAAGAAMILVVAFFREVRREEAMPVQGWSIVFGVLGAVLSILGGLMATTWPLKSKPQANLLFGEPTFFLGILLLAFAIFLATHARWFAELTPDTIDRLARVARPVSWLVAVLGIVLVACTITIFRFTAFGAAPAAEPIMGVFANAPLVENTLVGVMYALAAVGTCLAPWAVADLRGAPARTAGWAFMIGGIGLLAYSAMNYYTHVGLLMGK